MQKPQKDQQNDAARDVTEGRSPRCQTIADLSVAMKNYLAQPGVDLQSVNMSSDPIIGAQNPEQNALKTQTQTVPAPFESENENQPLESADKITVEALQCTQPQPTDLDQNQVACALSQGQQKGDPDSFQTAPGPENKGGQNDSQAQNPIASNLATTVQTLLNTTDAQDKHQAPAPFPSLASAANGLSSESQPMTNGVETQAFEPKKNTEEFEPEKSEKVNGLDNEKFDHAGGSEDHSQKDQIQSEVIQSQSIENHEVQRVAGSPAEVVTDVVPTGRAVRKCVKNTPNYSHTHRGITSSQVTSNVTPFDAGAQDSSKIEPKDPEMQSKAEQRVSQEERKGQAAESKQNKLLGKRSYEDICRSYQNMFAFDWELKDINNLRHPPAGEVTPIVVWFYINILFFPYNAHQLAQVPFEEFARPIFESLQRVKDFEQDEIQRLNQNIPLTQADNERQVSQSGCSQSAQSDAIVETDKPETALNNNISQSQVMPVEGESKDMAMSQRGYFYGDNSTPPLIQKLQIEEHFFEFRDLFLAQMREIKEKIDSKGDKQEDSEMKEADDENELEGLLHEENQESDDALFDQLESRFEQMVEDLSAKNKVELERQYSKFTNAYKQAGEQAQKIIEGKSSLVPRPALPYNPTKLHEYGLDFLSYVDPYFVADITQNREWYQQKQNEVLLNVSYPSKQEKEFLRHIEQWQQEKNDLNYKRILQQLAEGADDPENSGLNGLNIQRYNSLSAHKRGLVVQEDAQCAICNNGDYEDEDLIVFCGACNIPVHQRCYGIDEIPDNDWICNNCRAFYLRRGIMMKCILCPKRGGAMKPTNIFRTYEHFMHYHTAAQKKKGLHHTNYFANLASVRSSAERVQEIENGNDAQNAPTQNPSPADGNPESQTGAVVVSNQQQSLAICKQNSSRSQRFQFFEREDKNHALSQILQREGNFQDALIFQKKEEGENFPQNEVDLHFLESEAIAEIPEDYTFFLQRNEQRLECQETEPTESLYEWVHLSCAMWIPGPSVTPKTPVRMSKIDIKRFKMQCIICGKKNNGACVECDHKRCMISFHIECARRANYFLEMERVDRERSYRVFCEKHRPLKIVREMEEKDKQTLEEVQKFSKVVDKCLEIYGRAEARQQKQKRQAPFSKAPEPQPPTKRELKAEKKRHELDMIKQKKQQQESERIEKRNQDRIKREDDRKQKELQRKQKLEAAAAAKKAQVTLKPEKTQPPKKVVRTSEPVLVQVKWREKDKKALYERVRDRFLQLLKLRVNIQRVDPMIEFNKQKKIQEKKNKQEQRKIERVRKEKQDKKQAALLAKIKLSNSQRSGLRSRTTVNADDVPLDQVQNGSVGVENQLLNHQNTSEVAATIQVENPELKQDAFHIKEDLDRNNSQSEADDRRPTIEELIMPEQIDPFFKFEKPSSIQELDWAITFSKYDFPWHEIKFDKFSAKECFKKYTGSVRDAMTFYNEILGGKDKYKKYIAGQLNEAQRVFFSSAPQESSVSQAAVAQPIDKDRAIKEEAHESENIERFCKCRGEFNSLTGYFVMCENEDACPNGGWLHPECTRDLFKMTQEDILKLDKWYCEDCQGKQKNNQKGSQNNSNSKKQKTSSKSVQQQPPQQVLLKQPEEINETSPAQSNPQPVKDAAEELQTKQPQRNQTQSLFESMPRPKSTTHNLLVGNILSNLVQPQVQVQNQIPIQTPIQIQNPIQEVVQPTQVSTVFVPQQPLNTASFMASQSQRNTLASLMQRAAKVDSQNIVTQRVPQIVQSPPVYISSLAQQIVQPRQQEIQISNQIPQQQPIQLVSSRAQLPQLATLTASRNSLQSLLQQTQQQHNQPQPQPQPSQTQPQVQQTQQQPQQSSSKVTLSIGKFTTLPKFSNNGSGK